jgi:hypothetical protein
MDKVILHESVVTLGGCRGTAVELTRNRMHGPGRVIGVRIETAPQYSERDHIGYVLHYELALVRRLSKEEIAADPWTFTRKQVRYMNGHRGRIAYRFLPGEKT